MKVSPDVVVNAVSGADRLIGKIPAQMQQSVKGLFYLVMFGLVIGGAIYGVIMGKSAAEIKSTPIIERTNDAFDLDMKRERVDGNFSSMMDSDLINEIKARDVAKVKFETRANLDPEVDKGIIGPDFQKKAAPGAMQVGEPLIEDENRSKPRIDSSVKPVEKRAKPFDDEKDTVVQSEKKEISPLQNKKSTLLDRGPEKIDRKPGVKKLKRGKDIRTPERSNTEGIIEN